MSLFLDEGGGGVNVSVRESVLQFYFSYCIVNDQKLKAIKSFDLSRNLILLARNFVPRKKSENLQLNFYEKLFIINRLLSGKR